MASTLIIVIVFILDLIAFALAVAAEQRRSTVNPSHHPNLRIIPSIAGICSN